MSIQLVLQGFVDMGNHSRFWTKVDIRAEDECWHWAACRDKYGRFGIWKNPKGQNAIAQELGLSKNTINKVVLRKTWKHIS